MIDPICFQNWPIYDMSVLRGVAQHVRTVAEGLVVRVGSPQPKSRQLDWSDFKVEPLPVVRTLKSRVS